MKFNLEWRKKTAKIPSSLKYVNVELLAYRDKEDMICKIDEYINKLK